jgi:integrase
MLEVKGFFNCCVNAGLIDHSPLARMKLIEPKRRKHPAPKLDEVNDILDAATDSGVLHPVLAVCAFAGLRIEEVQELTPAVVDLRAAEINVLEGKTDAAARTVPMHPRLHAMLSDYGDFSGQYLFNAAPSLRYPKGDHHINPRTINTDFKSIAESLGLTVGRENQGLTLHALRRFFKTTCMDAGVPKPLVDLWMGHHSKDNIDNHYYHTDKAAEWMAKVPF